MGRFYACKLCGGADGEHIVLLDTWLSPCVRNKHFWAMFRGMDLLKTPKAATPLKYLFSV